MTTKYRGRPRPDSHAQQLSRHFSWESISWRSNHRVTKYYRSWAEANVRQVGATLAVWVRSETLTAVNVIVRANKRVGHIFSPIQPITNFDSTRIYVVQSRPEHENLVSSSPTSSTNSKPSENHLIHFHIVHYL